VSLNAIALEKEYINYLTGLRDQLRKDQEIEIESVYETPSVVSSDVRVITSEGWKIYFNTEISLRKELEMLSVSLENKIDKSRRKDLEYVDLRSDNKVFYKFKNSSEEEKKEEIKTSSDGTVLGDEDAASKKEDKKKKKK